MGRVSHIQGEVKGEIRGRIDCRHLADRLGLRIKKRTGANWQGHCFGPNHRPGDPNAHLSIGSDGYQCWSAGCDIKGDCFALVQAVRGCSFPEALEYLAQYAGVNPSSSRPPGPPPTHQEPAPKAPDRVEIPEARVEVMRALWEVLEPVPFGEGSLSWLAGRNLGHYTAHDLWVRDWAPAFGKVAAVLKRFPPEAKIQAGLYDERGPWAPLARAMKGDPASQGIGIPICVPEHDFPVAWRWRFFRPGKVKELAQPGSGPDPLFGLRGRNLWIEDALHSDLVVIAEGVPDALSVADCLQVDGGVIGVCGAGAARNWPDRWTRYIQHAGRVVVMLHSDHEDEATGAKEDLARVVQRRIKLSLARLIGEVEAGKKRVAAVPVRKVGGAGDCNDLHKAGKLWDVVSGVLDKLEVVTNGTL